MKRRSIECLRIPLQVSAFVALALIAGAATAAEHTYFGTYRITAGNSPRVEVGDLYHIEFTYEDQATDQENSSASAAFPQALVAFTVMADPSNTGTWDPSQATIPVPGRIDAFSTRVHVRPRLQNAPNIGGVRPRLIDFTFRPFSLNDNGSGQTFEEIVTGGFPSELGDFNLAVMQVYPNSDSALATGELITWGVGENPLPVQSINWSGIKALY